MATTAKQPYSVLIADDDPASREALQEIVAPEGYRTLLAESGEEALDIIRGESVHLVITDMHMPRLSGLDLLKLLRQMWPTLPSILITADATADLVRQAFAAHAFSVIPKPVSKHVVLYTVVRAIVRVYGPEGPPVPPSPPSTDTARSS